MLLQSEPGHCRRHFHFRPSELCLLRKLRTCGVAHVREKCFLEIINSKSHLLCLSLSLRPTRDELNQHIDTRCAAVQDTPHVSQ